MIMVIWNSKKIEKNKIKNINRKWKEENKQYLDELQRFFDRADNIKDIDLKQSIINQMMICDEILTKIAENKFEDFYREGYEKAKNG